MTVSVLMATFNGERYLADQLGSLAAQSLAPDELVVCDDGSTDRTVEMVQSFARDVSFPVRVHCRPETLGATPNFLSGTDLCRGSLIAFCDQDNVWTPNKLERCVRAFDAPAVVLAVHSAEVVDGQLRTRGQRFPDFSRTRTVGPRRFDPLRSFAGFAMVVRTGLVRFCDWRVRPPSQAGQRGTPKEFDEWIAFLAHLLGRTTFIAEPLAYYRQHGNNLAGAPGAAGLGAALRRAARTPGGEKSLSIANLASDYAAFVWRLAEGRSGVVRELLIAGAAFYARMFRVWDARAALYEARTSRWRAMVHLARLLASGGYEVRTRGGLGSRSLLKDTAAVLGVV